MDKYEQIRKEFRFLGNLKEEGDNDAELIRNIGKIMAGRFSDVVVHLRNFPSRMSEGNKNVLLAAAEYNLGSPEKALEYIAKAKEEIDLAGLHLLEARCHMSSREQDGIEIALGCLKKAVERDPENAEIWYRRGECFLYADPEQARDCFDRSIFFDPQNRDSWYYTGWLYSPDELDGAFETPIDHPDEPYTARFHGMLDRMLERLENSEKRLPQLMDKLGLGFIVNKEKKISQVYLDEAKRVYRFMKEQGISVSRYLPEVIEKLEKE